MRCLACNDLMTNRDTSRKNPKTGNYYDLCSPCFETIKDQVEWVENPKYSEEENDGSEPATSEN